VLPHELSGSYSPTSIRQSASYVPRSTTSPTASGSNALIPSQNSRSYDICSRQLNYLSYPESGRPHRDTFLNIPEATPGWPLSSNTAHHLPSRHVSSMEPYDLRGLSAPPSIVPSHPFNILRLNNETSTLDHLASTSGPSRLQDAQTSSAVSVPRSHFTVPHGIHGSSHLNESAAEFSTPASPVEPTSTGHLIQKSASPPASVEERHSKKKHKCHICGKCWARPSSLKIHLVKHTLAKPYLCHVCNQLFGVKSNYTRHVRRKHSESVDDASHHARFARRNERRSDVRFVDEGPRFGP